VSLGFPTRTAAAEGRVLLYAALAAAGLVSTAFLGFDVPIGEALFVSDLLYLLIYPLVDLTNRVLGARAARRVVYAAVAAEVALSLGFDDLHMAIVFGSALLWSQLLNVWLFDRLRRRASWWQAPLFSSAAAYALDVVIVYGTDLVFWDDGLLEWAVEDYLIRAVLLAVLLLPYRMILTRLPAAWRDGPADAPTSRT